MGWKLDIAGYPRFDTSTVQNAYGGFYDNTKTANPVEKVSQFFEIKISGATVLSLSASVAALAYLLF